MRFIFIGLVLILLGLQYTLWRGDDSLLQWLSLEKKLEKQTKYNQQLSQRNHAVEADIAELKSGEQALEERARYELGMVKEDEVYYQFLD